jgi:pimeloyl-[acyl-carrier protein] methyl ester esterase
MNLNIQIKGKGKPLVLFHGWGFDHRIWLKLAEALEGKYQFYLVDLPGFGASSDMDWEDFKYKLSEKIPQQFALAGWSMGGLFATRLALEKPQQVSYLINIASSPFFIQKKGWPGIKRSVFENIFRDLSKDPREVVSQFISSQSQNQSSNYCLEKIPALKSLKAGLDILINWDLREPLLHFNKPACFIFGRLDAITPRVLMTAMQKNYPNFEYVMFDKASHMPFLSHQNEFITVLERILE